jgi:hypothetical protein
MDESMASACGIHVAATTLSGANDFSTMVCPVDNVPAASWGRFE